MPLSPSYPTTQNNLPRDMIDLGVGDVQRELLPLERLWQAAEQRFSAGDRGFLQYGIEAGDGFLRVSLAEFLSRGYGLPVDPSTLFITTGASSALDLICSLFTQSGDVVLVEEPTYFLALRIFADHKLQPLALPMDERGLVVEAMEDVLKEIRPAFIYIVPTHQNPSGLTLSQERRKRLVELSREYGFLIVADEVYHLLSYAAQPPAPLAEFCEHENVFSLGSFSKILAPGLRLGWIQAHPRRVVQLAGCGLLDSGGGMNPFTSAIVREIVKDGGLAEHVSYLRTVYGERATALETALQRSLPEVAFTQPRGGFFCWARLPQGIDAASLLKHAVRYKVQFRPGVLFSSQGGLNDRFRIAISYYPAEKIVEGVERLEQALRSFGKV